MKIAKRSAALTDLTMASTLETLMDVATVLHVEERIRQERRSVTSLMDDLKSASNSKHEKKALAVLDRHLKNHWREDF